jgi:hypothetical protein
MDDVEIDHVEIDNNRYLYPTIWEFFDSPMWTGDISYRQEPLHKWFGWIYIAEFNSFEKEKYLQPKPEDVPNLKFKIGTTENIVQRKAALEVSANTQNNIQNSSTIIYSWSLPKAHQFETKIKQFLKAFIQKERLKVNTSGRSEITHGLTLGTLIHVIQLCVLDTCLFYGYLNCEKTWEKDMKSKLSTFLESPPDVIKENGTKYNGQKLSKNVQTIFDVDKVWKIVSPEEQAKYPESFTEAKEVTENFTEKQARFVQWVFNSGTDDPDDRIENPNLKDSDTITDDFVQENPNKTNIKNPYFVGECVFTNYKKTYMPCRIIGYGLGLHSGTYAIEWLDFRLDNDIMTFPIDDGGRYKTWLDIVGNPARHEYKSPNEVFSWHTVRTKHERPDVEQWPTNADREKRDKEDRRQNPLVNRAAYTYAASPDKPIVKPIVNNRIRFLQHGDWWRGTIVEVNKMYKWYKVQADTGGTTQKRFNEITTEKYAQTWEFLTEDEDAAVADEAEEEESEEVEEEDYSEFNRKELMSLASKGKLSKYNDVNGNPVNGKSSSEYIRAALRQRDIDKSK